MDGRWVVLELDGEFNRAGFRVTLEIPAANNLQSLKVKGLLPPDPTMLDHLHRHWQEVYCPLGMPLRIKGQKIIYKGFINQRLVDCQQSAQILRERFQTWLNAESFQLIDRRLREELSRDETIRFLIRTQNVDVQRLPWQEWDFFERYPHAEIALSTSEYEAGRSTLKLASPHPVRILAILGHSTGINVEADRRLLAQLPQAQVTFLVEPDRRELNDHLWEMPWDILFFAGHSETDRDQQGRIFLNPTDSLTLAELRYGLRRAIDQGLQLAIFNSCDGLGLVHALQRLSIPQMIVMREPVVDQVAAAFLRYFLEAFASGESLYLSARQARERLQGLEHQYPCASWLPIIYQNLLLPPPDWLTLQGKSLARSLPHLESRPDAAAIPASAKLWDRWQVVWTSLIVTLMVLMVQYSGLLQPFELAAYDQMMRSRPAETIDSRILVVEVTQADLNELGGYPLSDDILVKTVDVLQPYEPTAIAFDMHRFRPRGNGRQALLERFRQYPNLFTVCSYGQSDQDYGSPPEFSEEQTKRQVGFSDFLLDQTFSRPAAETSILGPISETDGTVRRQLLSYSPDLAASSQSSCSTPYSLSFQLAYQFLRQAEVTPLTITKDGYWQLGNTVFPHLPRRFGAYQNLDGLSSQLMLNYRSAQPGKAVSLQSVLTGQLLPDTVRNRLVLVGYTAPVARDHVNTPYGKMAGVWVHSHMVSQLISAVLDQRSLIQKLPRWKNLPCLDGVWILMGSLIGSTLASWLYTRRPLSIKLGIPLGLSFILLAIGWSLTQVSVIAIAQGLWLPVLPAVLSVFLAILCVAIMRELMPDHQN